MRRWWLVAALGAIGCQSPERILRPVIHSNKEERISAIRLAPIVPMVEIQDHTLSRQPREVDKPPQIGGPMMPRIPLYLAKISAKVLLTLRGSLPDEIQFYSWVWSSGKHGGPRLFQPSPGSLHILFLHDESGYLHTVGDYPAYDLEIQRRWLRNSLRPGAADAIS